MGKTIHGMSHTREYISWSNMRDRCGNPNNNRYQYYGGKGISICERWTKFANFYEDMGARPEGTSLDRKDRTKNYTLDNCVWSDIKTQNRNRSVNVELEFNGETKLLVEWCEELGLTYQTVYSRLRAGRSVEYAFTHPVRGRG